MAFSTVQLILFISGAIFLILLSRKSLGNIKVHGFYRFFAFELTFILALLNIPFWFLNHFSWIQIISWIFLSVSLLFILESIYSLSKSGGSKKREGYSSNIRFENTAFLVTGNIYRYIRHPMYSSILFLAWGIMLKNINLITLLLASAVLIFLILTAKAEEYENVRFFGNSYTEYKRNTKMFVPFIF